MNGYRLNTEVKANGSRYTNTNKHTFHYYGLRPRYNHMVDSVSNRKEVGQPSKNQFEGVNNLGLIILLIFILTFLRDNIKNSGYILFKDRRIIKCILYDCFYLMFFNIIKGLLTVPTFGMYKLFLHNKISEKCLFTFHFIYLLIFIITNYIIQPNLSPLLAGASSIFLINFAMKMHSYIITNLHLHIDVKKNYEEIVGSNRGPSSFSNSPMRSIKREYIYPRNVELKDYLRFVFAVPMLVYETRFLWIRKRRMLYVLFELFCLLLCALGIILDFSLFILPITLEHRGDTLRETLQDIFHLSIPSLFVWILMFYCFNHCWLNFFSEVVGFSNREFYSDWWNSSSIKVFWRKWNFLYSEWSLRHLYIDSIYYFNVSKRTAEIILFIFNTLVSQLHLSFAFKIGYPFFIIVMICQLSLMFSNKALRNSKRDGNYILWVSLMINLPLLEILYFRSWVGNTQKREIDFWCH